MIKRRVEPTFVARDSRRQHRDFKSHCAQQSAKRSVQLVTNAPASFVENFADHLLFIKNNLAAKMVIKILKRNRQQMSLVQLSQGLRGHVTGTAIVHSFKIPGNIHLLIFLRYVETTDKHRYEEKNALILPPSYPCLSVFFCVLLFPVATFSLRFHVQLVDANQLFKTLCPSSV